MKKEIETSIKKLETQRRLNVQEQVLLRKHKISSEAKHWRVNGIPKPLEQILKAKGIDLDKSIILNYEQDFYGMSTDNGIVLTPEGVFYAFDADLNTDRTALIELYSFTDVSEKFEIDTHKKGIGKTDGFLAMEVLQELNNEAGLEI